MKAAHLAVKLIESAEPRDSAVLTLEGEIDPEAIDSLSLSQLLQLAEAHGITPPPALSAPEAAQ